MKPRKRIVPPVVAFWTLAAVLAGSRSLAACDGEWGERLPILERELRFDDRVREERRMLLPPGREVIVMAIEHGIDVTLTIQDGSRSFTADSPLRRHGVQRVMVRPFRATSLTAIVEAKALGSPEGRVRLMVVAAPTDALSASCLATHRALAHAEAAYARGDAIRNASVASTGGDAGKAYAASAAAYREALTWLNNADSPLLRAQVQQAIGAVSYQGTQNWADAEQWSAQAAAGLRALGDAYGATKADAMRAAALMELEPAPGGNDELPSNLQLAIALLDGAVDVHASRAERYDQALATNDLGIARYMNGEHAAAVQAYRSAEALYRGLHDRTRQAQVMGNLALVEYRIGNLAHANALYADLRGLIDAQRNPALHVNVLNNSALSLAASGRSDLALEMYEQALSAARRMQDRYYEAVSLQGMGTIYEGLGDTEAALGLFRRALALRTVELGAWLRVETLWSIANIQRLNGRAQESLSLDNEALQLASTPLDSTRMQLQVALDHEALDRPQDVLATTDAILTQRVAGDELIRAKASLVRGRALARTDPQAAAAALRTAIVVFRKFELSTEEFNGLVALGQLLRENGDRAAGLKQVEAAIDLAERMRMQSANPELRATVLQSLRPAFDLKIDLLADRHFSADSADAARRFALQALETAERARARSLQDVERLEFIDRPGSEPLLERRRELYAALGQYRVRFDASVDVLSADDGTLEAIRRGMDDTKRQLDQLDAKLAAQRGIVGGQLAPRLPIDALPQRATLVEYWIGAEQAYAWIVRRQSLTMIRLGPSRDIIAAAAQVQRELRDYASGTAASRLARLDALSTLVWSPLRERIVPGTTLVFVPDTVLHYIPFAALVDAGATRRFLIEDHDVATAPSLRLLLSPMARQQARADRLLMVADPVYGADDPRLASASPATHVLRTGGATQRRLKGAGREADAIASLYPPERTDRLQGLDATKERFLRAPMQEYRYIHVASHAVADAQIPQLSALLLTSVDARARRVDGRVLAADLMNLRLNADLVVLSACDTALGRVVSGEGVVGLRYVMLARGAKAVASSLWKVADRTTAELMTRFYASVFTDNAGALAALSNAMRASIAARGPDPALWAAFDLSIRDVNLIR